MRKQSASQIIGREGERWLYSVLPREWLWQPPADDFGIDGTVAIGDEKFVTPFEFGVQVKSCKKWETSDEHLLVRGVPVDVVRYWAIRLVPTMLVAYEVSSQRINDGSSLHRTAVLPDKEMFISVLDYQFVTVSGVCKQPICDAWMKWHQALFVELGHPDVQDAGFEVDVIAAQRKCL